MPETTPVTSSPPITIKNGDKKQETSTNDNQEPDVFQGVSDDDDEEEIEGSRAQRSFSRYESPRDEVPVPAPPTAEPAS